MRRFVVTELISHGPVRLADVAAVVVTELATNALLHARPPFAVTLAHAESRLVLGVLDGSPVPPHVSPTADPMEMSRYGLPMVIHMSVDWGVTPGTTGGKTVWAAFDTRRSDFEPADPLETPLPS
ncbi:MAG: ATP-binding protein [Nocardioides sp.]